MRDTKEKILITALQLFARDGYEAVSVRSIAEEIGITKGALYRHYKNKRDIFDSIVERMIEIDTQRAKEFNVPDEIYENMPSSYEGTSLENIVNFTLEQLKFWTQDEFALLFRRMLVLEQYRNTEMAELYNQCIVDGPVSYTEDLFRELIKKGEIKNENPKQLAVEYYAPLFLLISKLDMAGESESFEEYIEILRAHTKHFVQSYGLKQ